jgi:hypothetical protein
VKWASSYQYTDAGEMRDQHRNVLPIGTAPAYDVELRLYDTARKTTFPRRDILAFEFFGRPEPYMCVIGGKCLPTEVLHLNRDPRDFSRDNLKYATGLGGRVHELDCIRWAMISNEVPARNWSFENKQRGTVSRRVRAIATQKAKEEPDDE